MVRWRPLIELGAVRAGFVYFFPTLCSLSSRCWLECLVVECLVVEYLYYWKLASAIKQTSPPLPESWMLNIPQHTAGREQAWRSNQSRLAPKPEFGCSLTYLRRVLRAMGLWFLTLKVKLILLLSLKTIEKIKWNKVMWNTSNRT